VNARHLLAGPEGLVDDAARLQRLQLGADERTALAGLDVLEVDDAVDGAVDLDVHAVLELVGGDGFSHDGEAVSRP
jgi:hypothetical protein